MSEAISGNVTLAPDFAFAHPGYGATDLIFKQPILKTQLRDLAAHFARVLI
jgi:hypothetical protein